MQPSQYHPIYISLLLSLHGILIIECVVSTLYFPPLGK